jgi:hypothetical protein
VSFLGIHKMGTRHLYWILTSPSFAVQSTVSAMLCRSQIQALFNVHPHLYTDSGFYTYEEQVADPGVVHPHLYADPGFYHVKNK